MVKDYYIADNPLPDGVEYKPVIHGVGGGQAKEKYDTYFLSGDDIDLYTAEAGWILSYLESSNAAPITDAGLTKSDFPDAYDYTMKIGESGGKQMAVSFQAAPGGFAYRSDLAEQYLDVKSPDEMQALVSDWDKFKETAKTVAEKSNKATALTASLGGMWQAFSSVRKEAWVTGGELNISKEVESFLEMGKEYRSNGWVTKVSQWTPEWNALAQTDKTMGYFASTWGVKDTGTDKDNGFLVDSMGASKGKTYGKWAMCEGPQNFFWGGTWLVAHPKADNGNEVQGIMKYFCADYDGMKKYAEKTGDYVNNKKVMGDLVAAGTNKNGALGGQDQFQLFDKVAGKISFDPSQVTKDDQTIKDLFMDAASSYADGSKGYATVDDAIQTFKENVGKACKDVSVG